MPADPEIGGEAIAASNAIYYRTSRGEKRELIQRAIDRSTAPLRQTILELEGRLAAAKSELSEVEKESDEFERDSSAFARKMVELADKLKVAEARCKELEQDGRRLDFLEATGCPSFAYRCDGSVVWFDGYADRERIFKVTGKNIRDVIDAAFSRSKEGKT